MSYFDQDDDSNRQSIVSEGIRPSSSLLSITEHDGKALSMSASVPDLRMMEYAGRYWLFPIYLFFLALGSRILVYENINDLWTKDG